MELDDGLKIRRPQNPDAWMAAFSSPKIESMLNQVFGSACEHVQGKSIMDILSLFERVIYPLPTPKDFDKVYKSLPPFCVSNCKSGEIEMSAYNFRMSEDWKVSFDTMIHVDGFNMQASLVDELMLVVLKAGLSVLFYQHIKIKRKPSHLC